MTYFPREFAWNMTAYVAIIALLATMYTAGISKLRISRGATAVQAVRTSALEGLTGVFLTPIAYIALLPGWGGTTIVNLTPLKGLISGSTAGILFIQILVHLVPYIPLGAVISLRWPRLATVPRILGIGLVLGSLAEIYQYLFLVGRVVSVDDVLLAMIGAGGGALLAYHWRAKPGLAGYPSVSSGDVALT